jgi:hypothetical protein
MKQIKDRVTVATNQISSPTAVGALATRDGFYTKAARLTKLLVDRISNFRNTVHSTANIIRKVSDRFAEYSRRNAKQIYDIDL